MAKKRLNKFIQRLLLAIGAIIIAGFLFVAWVESKIESVAQEAFGASLEYKGFSWSGNSIVLSNVVLKRVDPAKEVDYLVQFGQVSIQYFLELLKRQVAFDVHFDKPTASITKLNNNAAPWNAAQVKLLNQISKFKQSRKPFFKVSVRAKIDEGSIELIDKKGVSAITTSPVLLTYHGWEGGGLSNRLAVQKSEESLSEPLLLDTEPKGIMVLLERKQGKLTKEIIFSEVDCKDVINLAEYLAGPIFDPWKWHQGSLRGKFTLVDTESDGGYVQGEGVIHDARLDHITSGMGGYFQEMKLELSKRSFDKNTCLHKPVGPLEQVRYNTKGEMKFTQPASFFRNLDRASQWILKDILGSVVLGDERSHEMLHWSFEGSLTTYEEPDAKFELKGSLPIAFKEGLHGRITVKRDCQDRESVSTELLIKAIDASRKEVELSIVNWGPQELDVVQHLWPDFNSVGKNLCLQKGALSAKINAQLNYAPASSASSALSSIYVSQVKGKDLEFTWNAPEVEGYLDELSGWLNVGVIEKEGELSFSLKGSELAFSGGEIQRKNDLDQDSSSAGNKLINVSGSAAFLEDILQHGSIQGEFKGLKTELVFNGFSSEILGSVHAEGRVSDFLSLFPDQEKAKKVDGECFGDKVVWDGELKRNPGGLEAFGSLTVEDSSKKQYTAHLQALFERVSSEEWKHLHEDWKQLGLSCYKVSTSDPSPENRPSIQQIFAIDWLEDSFGIWGMKFTEGYFRTDHFPLERYLACIAPAHCSVNIHGMARFQGKFDPSSLLIHLHAIDAVLETPEYHIQMNEIGNLPDSGRSADNSSAFFYFDWVRKIHYGNILVANASFLEKKHNLLFTDVDAKVSCEGNIVKISEVNALSDEIDFSGNIEIDGTDPQMKKLTITAHKIAGSIPAAMKFSSHFSDASFWKIPLHGQFTNGEKGFILQASIPNDPQQESAVSWQIAGQLSRASYANVTAHSSLANLSVDLDYRSDDNHLLLSNIQSDLLVGMAPHQDAYEIKGGSVALREFPDVQAEFDISLSTNGKEFARLAGATRALGENSKDKYRKVDLDPQLTFIGKIFPKIHHLVLKNGTEISAISASPEIELSSFFDDLKRISKTGWLNIPVSVLSKAKLGAPHGLILAKLNSRENGGMFDFEALGSAVAWKGRPIGKLNINGSFSADGKYYLKKAQIGSLTLQADIEKGPESLIIRQLKASQGKGFSLSLKGEYQPAQQTCMLQVNECRADLAQLKAFPKWKSILEPWQVRGIVKLGGQVKIASENHTGMLDITGKVRALINGLEIRGMPINNTGPIDFSFSSQEGLRIQGVDLKVQRPDQSYYHANLALKSAKYEVEGDNLSLEGLDFTLSATGLSQLAQIGRDLFPDLFDEGISSLLKDFQCEGGLSGSLQMQLSPKETKVRLRLKDGRYLLWGKPCDLNRVTMDFDSHQICFRAQHAINSHLFNIRLEVDRPSMRTGRIVIKDLKEAGPDSHQPLIIHWEGDVKEGIIVKKVEGKIAGLEFNLKWLKEHHVDSKVTLTGYLKLNDGAKLAQILSPENRGIIKRLGLQRGYKLKGKFVMSKTHFTDMNFQGMVTGTQCTMFDCDIDSLTAAIHFTPKSILLNNLVASDKAGTLSIAEMSLRNDLNNKWLFNIPKMQIKKFKPSLLRRSKKGTSFKKLVIEDAELINLRGYFGEPASYGGTGSLYFENLPKKNFLERTLLLLPAEIIGRIGLNANVLEPAMGTILFSLKHGRAYIDKLQDVYSEGKRSRFYLAKENKNAYVDFDGNLHINVRTKQYNLLFKLAELGELSVRGNMDKPAYAFQQQMPPPRQAPPWALPN